MYAFQHEGRTFTPDGVAPAIVDKAHNTAVEAAELAEWAKQPERFAAYMPAQHDYDMARRRDRAGCLVEHVPQPAYRLMDASGSRQGTNGATYSGRYGSDWSQLVRLRRTKG